MPDFRLREDRIRSLSSPIKLRCVTISRVKRKQKLAEDEKVSLLIARMRWIPRPSTGPLFSTARMGVGRFELDKGKIRVFFIGRILGMMQMLIDAREDKESLF